MSIQKSKKGFTLIELMVVIVIIGILAAIAIPKLFGMSAKAKASELTPAAGTWIKLQQAYSLESSDYGSFVKIAYTAPNSKVFSYSGTPASETDAATAVFTATSQEALNDCPRSSIWTVTMTKGTSNLDNITHAYPTGASSGACEAVTPSFKNLASPSSASGGSAGSGGGASSP